jgi:hypothetical protein
VTRIKEGTKLLTSIYYASFIGSLKLKMARQIRMLDKLSIQAFLIAGLLVLFRKTYLQGRFTKAGFMYICQPVSRCKNKDIDDSLTHTGAS